MQGESRHDEVMKSITHVLDSQAAYAELCDKGWGIQVDKIMSDPVAVERLMKSYDMKWIYGDSDYKKQMANLRRNYAEITKLQNPDPKIAEAIVGHIFRMNVARPEMLVPGVLKQAPSNKEQNKDTSSIGEAAEPRLAPSFKEEWTSVRNHSVKPPANEPVILAGYHMAGILEYRIAYWISSEDCWDVPDMPESYAFAPLFWKPVGPAPKGYINEI